MNKRGMMCIPRLCTISRHDSQHQHGVGLNTISDLRLSTRFLWFQLYSITCGEHVLIVIVSTSALQYRLHWQHNFDSHVLSLMHDLTINDDLVHADTIVNSVCRICRRSDLNLTPLAIGRNQFAL